MSAPAAIPARKVNLRRPDVMEAVQAQVLSHYRSELIDRIKATPRQPGVSEIRLPGERAFRSREQALRDGIEIDRVVYEALKALHLD